MPEFLVFVPLSTGIVYYWLCGVINATLKFSSCDLESLPKSGVRMPRSRMMPCSRVKCNLFFIDVTRHETVETFLEARSKI
ncbi:unnamed protein product [Caenorhabditis brenneri]